MEYSIAHIREQGVDLIIIPLAPSFDHRTVQQQKEEIANFQLRAKGANLAGTVVPIWRSGNITKFIAPHGFHPFFKGISFEWAVAQCNKKLIW